MAKPYKNNRARDALCAIGCMTPSEADTILRMLRDSGFVVVPLDATNNMANYAKHRNPGVSPDLARGVWCNMVDEATNGL